MFIKKYGDLITGIFFAVLGAVGLVLACNFADPIIQVPQTIGSRFFPKLVCIAILIFSVLLIAFSLPKLKTKKEAKADEEETPEYKRVIASMAAFIIYVLLMERIGFLIMSMIYLPVQMYMIAPSEKQNKKNMITYILIGIFSSCVIYFSFVYGFRIILPAGVL